MKIILAIVALAMTACGGQMVQSDKSTPVVMGETISLLIPDSVGGVSINEALWNRHSSRDFQPVALSLEELSGVVWAASGINRPGGNHLTAPSALALYPVRTYAFFADGVYLYDAVTHMLTRVRTGDLRALSGAQPFVEEAPLNLVLIADLNVYDGRDIPIEHVRYLCGQDAATSVENVNLYAAGHRLRSVTRGSASTDLLPALGLDTMRYMFALAVSVGK